MFEKAKVSFFLASKSILRGNKGIAFFTIIVLTLVYLQLVFFSSMIGGVTMKFNDVLVDYQTGNIVIEPAQDEAYITNVDALSKKIEHIPEVTGVSPRLRLKTSVSYKEKEVGATIYGIDPQEEELVTDFSSAMVEGEFISKLDRGEIVLGREISGGYGAVMQTRSLEDVEVGDIVTVLINGQEMDFRVKGIYSTLFFMSDSSAFVNIADLEDALNADNKAQEIAIKLQDGSDEDVVMNEILSLGIQEEVRSWTEFAGILQIIEGTLSMVRNIFTAVGLIVAFVIIFVVIFVNIVSQKRQIGVQKAIGIEEEVIIASFVLQAMFYAFIAMVIGYSLMQFVITGYTQAHPISAPIGNVSLDLSNSEAVIRAMMLFMAAVLGSLIPSYKMTKRSLLDLIWGSN
ncbi:ABC-type transport system, involved in lipoprotein release, permease component [Methanolobus tindarius DSM 2278]|uniref:ABC-type transport system, involved in lipoprotein release, permease component n=1 Tax=Methanolobus tindarius DSM 2278 TaxID=1090322 RepID=W9DXK8_METTI|nr:FtsX-like permease family protein [Methanolobus tindarius]ETA68146.1 ABC-type transport system, involved in lipoprotein release, permease component [Methanolobus tindarius DSM 2278]